MHERGPHHTAELGLAHEKQQQPQQKAGGKTTSANGVIYRLKFALGEFIK